MSGLLLIAEYGVTVEVTRFASAVQSLILTFDADFIVANEIDMDIDGTAITTVPFNATHAQTLLDLATEIESQATIDTATVTGARAITITCEDEGNEIVMTNIVVSSGVSQADNTISARTDGYVDGLFDDGTSSTFDIVISAQPLTGRELQILPEGERTRRYMKGYTATRLYTASQSSASKADRLVFDSTTFEVQAVEVWNGDLTHYKVMLAEVKSE